MSRYRVLFVAAVAVAVLAAATAQAAGKEVVTFWTYGAAHINKIMETLAEDFEKENPGIDIEVVPVTGQGGAWEKWAVAAAAGIPPDASLAGWGIFETLGEALEPLEGWAEKSTKIKRSNFFDVHWDVNWYGKHMLGLPFRANSTVILYDKNTFAEAGLDVQAQPKSWEELREYAARLTKRTGDTVQRYGFSFRNAENTRTVDHFAERNGWQPFNPEFTAAYYTDRKLIQALEFLNGMVTSGFATVRGMPLTGQLAQGRVAMLNDGIWSLNTLLTRNPALELAGFLPPAGPSGAQPYANLTGEILVMFRDSKHKEATWKWLTYLAYDRNADYARMTGTFFPVVRYAARDRYWFASEIWRPVLQNYTEGRAPVKTVPCGVSLAAEDLYPTALDDILFQRKAIQPALAEVQAVAEADLRNPELVACPTK